MLAKHADDRYQTPEELYQALTPFFDQQMAPPPEHEMPQLSPAARDQSNAPSSSLSGSMRQDSATMLRDQKQRSGRMAAGSGSGRMGAPTATVAPPGQQSGRHGGSGSSTIRNPFPVAPVTSPSGPSSRPTAETRRMSNTTERTPMSERRGAAGYDADEREPEGFFANHVVRILAEAVVVFGLALGIWWAYTKFFG
jgi:hypothetical protein